MITLIIQAIVRWSGTRVTCEMVSDGGGRFIPAGTVDFHTLYLLLAFLVAHDRAMEDTHTHTQEGNGTTEHKTNTIYTARRPSGLEGKLHIC